MDEQAANVFLRMSILLDRGALQTESAEAGHEAGERFTESFKENIKSLAVGFIAFEGIKEGLQEVIGGASELAEATDRAKVAAENAGVSWGSVESAMKAAESAGEKLGFTNAQVADTYGILVTRTGDVSRSNLELAEAEDVARFRHLTLADAADKVNRANQGNVRALKDLNIILPANASEAEKAAAVTKYFAAQQGQAAEYANSLAGKMATAKAQFADAAAALGTELTPALIAATSFFVEHNKAILITAASVGGLYLAYKSIGGINTAVRLATDALSGAMAKENAEARQAMVNSAVLADAKAREALVTARAAAANSQDAVALAEVGVAEDRAAAAAAGLTAAEEASTAAADGFGASLVALAASPGGAIVALIGLTEVAGKLADLGAKATPRVEELTGELDKMAEAGGKIDVSSVAEADKSMRDFGDVVDRIARPGIAARIADLPLVSGHLTGTNDQLKRARELVSNLDQALTEMVQSGHADRAAVALKAVEQGMSPAQIQRLTSLLPNYSDELSRVGREGSDVASKLTDMSKAMADQISLLDAEAALTDHWKQTAAAVQSAKDTLASARDTEVRDQQAVADAQANVNKARQEAAQNIRDLRQQTESLAAAEGDAADKLEHARRAAAAAARLDPHSLRYQEIQHSLADAQAGYDDAVGKSAKSRADLAAAERKGIDDSDAVVAAKRALHDAQVQDQKDTAAVTKARQALSTANDANSHSFDLNTAAGRENAKLALQIKTDWEKANPSLDGEATALGNIYKNLGLTNDQMGLFIQQAPAAATAAEQVTSALDTPAPRSEDYYGPAASDSGSQRPPLWNDPGTWFDVWKTTAGVPWLPNPFGFAGHAAGGDLDEGMNLLGEQGPEWVQKSGSRVQVFRSGDTPPAAATGGGVHLHLNNVTVNQPVDVDMILQKLEFAARRWG